MLITACPSHSFPCYFSQLHFQWWVLHGAPWLQFLSQIPYGIPQFHFSPKFCVIFLICAVRCVVGIVTEIQAGWLRNCGLIPTEARYFSLQQIIQNGRGAHAFLYSLASRGHSPVGKVVRAQNWPLTYVYRVVHCFHGNRIAVLHELNAAAVIQLLP